jgi:hypothetical protein
MDTSVGSCELDTEKSTLSWIIKEVPLGDSTVVFSEIVIA